MHKRSQPSQEEGRERWVVLFAILAGGAMRLAFASILFTTCTGGSTSPSNGSADPVTAPGPTELTAEPAAETEPAEVAWRPESQGDLDALLAASASEEIINELSGESVGRMYTLTEPVTILGVPCKQSVHTYSGTWGCTLAEPLTRNDFSSRANTWGMFHYMNGMRAVVVFSDLLEGAPATVQGLPCANYAHFHGDSSLARCTLMAPHTIGSNTFAAETDLELRPDGSVESAMIYEDATLGGQAVPAGMIMLKPDGTVDDVMEGYFGD